MANPKPENNVQHFLAKIAGVDTSTPVPQTIEEYYLEKIAEGLDGGVVSDVKVDGVSIVTDGVASVPVASSTEFGVAKTSLSNGITIDSTGRLATYPSNSELNKAGADRFRPIIPYNQHSSTFYGLAKAAGADEKNSVLPVGQYTQTAKSAISEMLNGAVTVTGTTPIINALSGIRYICGEVSTLAITLPASGIVDVTFTSGTTATVLTITPPTGVTLKWVNDFDPTSLEANTTYELNIMDGLGVAASWT